MKKLTMLLTFVFVLIQVIAFTQAYEDYGSFRFYYNGMIGTGDEVKIEFIDTTVNKTINSFSMVEKNPYNHLNFPVEKISNYGPEYKTYKIEIEQLKNNELPFELKKSSPTTESFEYAYMWTYHTWGIFEDTSLMVRFYLALGGSDMIFASRSTFFIFDKYGNVVSVFDDIDKVNIGESAITGQRYLVCTYGGWNHLQNQRENFGYLAYDLKDNKLIDQDEFEGRYRSIGIIGFNGFVRVGLVKHDNTEDLIYLDFEKNKKYKKNLHMNLLLSTKEINRDGFIYQRNGKSDTLLFNRDFKVEDIQ